MLHLVSVRSAFVVFVALLLAFCSASAAPLAEPVAGTGVARELPAAATAAPQPREDTTSSLDLTHDKHLRGHLRGHLRLKGRGAFTAAVFYGPAHADAWYLSLDGPDTALRSEARRHSLHIRLGRLDLHLVAVAGSVGFVAARLDEADLETTAPTAKQLASTH